MREDPTNWDLVDVSTVGPYWKVTRRTDLGQNRYITEKERRNGRSKLVLKFNKGFLLTYFPFEIRNNQLCKYYYR